MVNQEQIFFNLLSPSYNTNPFATSSKNRKTSEETKRILSEIAKARPVPNNPGKPIKIIDTQIGEIQFVPSVSHAAKFLSSDRLNLHLALKSEKLYRNRYLLSRATSEEIIKNGSNWDTQYSVPIFSLSKSVIVGGADAFRNHLGEAGDSITAAAIALDLPRRTLSRYVDANKLYLNRYQINNQSN